jgi:hypothetical protein
VIALIWLCLLACALPAAAQERLTAMVDHNTLRVGENVTLTLEFSGATGGVPQPTFPELQKLQLAGGPYTSTNFSIVNGHASSTTSYSYSLRAIDAGTGRIGEAVLKFKNKEYRSNPITVNIISGGATATTGAGKGNESGDVFIKVYPDKTEAYLGEQITLVYKIYFASQISNLEPTKAPGTTGFWVEEYPLPQQLTVSREVLNGRAYNTAVFKKIALFPTSVGNLTVEPLSISTQVQRQRQRSGDPFDIFNDPIFGSLRAPSEPIEISSPSVRINVKPLPAGAPAGFSGAVGTYRIQSALDRNACQTGDAATLTVTISGNGNIKTLPEPVIKFPPDLDHYDPEANDDIRRDQPHIGGTKTFKYVVIPRAPGSQMIPAVTLAYFDPDAGHYNTATTSEIPLQVSKGEGNSAYMSGVVADKRKVESVSTDIAFVKTTPGRFVPLGTSPHERMDFWGFTLAPWAIVAAALVVSRKRQTLTAGRRGALLKAQKQIAMAERALKSGKNEMVLHHIAAAMDTVLSGAIGADVTSLTSDHLAELWQKENLDSEVLRDITDVQGECDRARFAAGGSIPTTLRSLIATSRSIVERLGRTAPVKAGAR